MDITKDKARTLITRSRKQQQNRRATMLERSVREVLPPDLQR